MKKDRFISLNAAIEAIHNYWIAEMDKLPRKMAGEYEVLDGDYKTPLRHNKKICEAIEALPSAQPPKEVPKRVLWSGWQGYRDTRYRCPLCKKLVRNDDVYCHRCGQHLMFPNISFTPYIPGQKQDVIVRWEDEG